MTTVHLVNYIDSKEIGQIKMENIPRINESILIGEELYRVQNVFYRAVGRPLIDAWVRTYVVVSPDQESYAAYKRYLED